MLCNSAVDISVARPTHADFYPAVGSPAGFVNVLVHDQVLVAVNRAVHSPISWDMWISVRSAVHAVVDEAVGAAIGTAISLDPMKHLKKGRT